MNLLIIYERLKIQRIAKKKISVGRSFLVVPPGCLRQHFVLTSDSLVARGYMEAANWGTKYRFKDVSDAS